MLIAFNWIRKHFLSSTSKRNFFVALHNHIISTFFFLTHFHLCIYKQFIITHIFCMLFTMFALFVIFIPFFFSNRSQFHVFTVTFLYWYLFWLFSRLHFQMLNKSIWVWDREKMGGENGERKKCIHTLTHIWMCFWIRFLHT